jgi:hypothetical protein
MTLRILIVKVFFKDLEVDNFKHHPSHPIKFGNGSIKCKTLKFFHSNEEIDSEVKDIYKISCIIITFYYAYFIELLPNQSCDNHITEKHIIRPTNSFDNLYNIQVATTLKSKTYNAWIMNQRVFNAIFMPEHEASTEEENIYFKD